MENWKRAWEIIDEEVTCRTCGARQSPRDARQAFKHCPGCALTTPAAQVPWRDLAAVLRKLRRP